MKKRKRRGNKARRLIPCTDSVLLSMFSRVARVLQDHGLVDVSGDLDARTDQAMQILDAQGATTPEGLPMGRCVLLPPRGGRSADLLLVSPWPAEEYDDNLQRKPSPVMFDRTKGGRIVIPARMFLAKFEELARNPAAPERLKILAMTLARRSAMPDIVVPAEVETLALTVLERTGTETILEALPTGLVISINEPLEGAE